MAEHFIIELRDHTQKRAGQKVGGAGGIGNKTGGSKATTTATDDKSTLGASVSELTKAAKAGLSLIGFQGAKGVVDEIVTFNNSLIELRTGSREQQQRATFAYSTASGLVNSVISGATGGAAMAGAVGAASGAVLGLVKSIFSTSINFMKQEYVIAEQRNLERLTQNAAAQRVTVSGSRYMTASQK